MNNPNSFSSIFEDIFAIKDMADSITSNAPAEVHPYDRVMTAAGDLSKLDTQTIKDLICEFQCELDDRVEDDDEPQMTKTDHWDFIEDEYHHGRRVL